LTATFAAGHRMSRVDTAWLRMDNEANLMMIVGVWLLTPAVDLATVRERVGQRLLKYERFRQCAVQDATGAVWVDDRAFDLAHHVVQEPLQPEPGQSPRAALQARCGELAMQPLPAARPLWQFHLVPDYEGGCALIARIHHCIGDGIALISVMNTITDGGAEPPLRRRRPGADDHAEELDWLSQAVLRPLTELTVKAIDLSGQGMVRSIDWLAHPQQPLHEGWAAAGHGLQVLRDLAALALMPDDSPTRLKGRPVGRKQVAWSEPMPLDAVRTVGKALGCSINDVLLACASGALGQWLQGQGDDTTGQEIRAMVPVNLRPLDQAWKLGNRFGLAPLVLPIGIDNPVERLYTVRARMDALKGSYQPLLAFAVLAASGALAKPLQDLVLGLFAKKTTAVMTNVPGPRAHLKFCGATLRQSMFWVPASGSVGVGVSILSYAGGVQFGLITDEALCPAPQQVIDRFVPEFDKLACLAMMLPWGGEAADPA